MYQLTETESVRRVADGAIIPADPTLIDRQEYEAWLADGGMPQPYVPPPVHIPQQVSKFQAKAALRGAGLLDQVEQMMADPAADPLAVLAWTDAQEFRRSSPTVAAMAGALGLDAAALDALFTTAAGIEA